MYFLQDALKKSEKHEIEADIGDVKNEIIDSKKKLQRAEARLEKSQDADERRHLTVIVETVIRTLENLSKKENLLREALNKLTWAVTGFFGFDSEFFS